MFKLNYEYWSYKIFYAPFVPLWLWYSARSMSLTYFCNANPGIEWGGFYNYSKYNILKQIDFSKQPKAQFIKKQNLSNASLELEFPIVAKPDKGERGKQVEVLRTTEDWKLYIKNCNSDVLLQEFMEEPLEFGIFYVRMPNEEKGKILSITSKEFLIYKGNGKQSLKEFIERNPRSKHRISYLKKKFKDSLDVVLKKGESLLLEEVGNHNRGTKFLDASEMLTDSLSEEIDRISKQIKEFYYGRYDVKAESIEDFKNGKFRIIEVNGSNSEATHIYDPKYNLKFAYKEVFRHLKWQFKIAKQNRRNGFPWHSTAGFLKALVSK